MKRRWVIAGAALILYVAMLCATWDVATQRAKRQTESMLDYAMMDLDSTLNGSIDTMLMHIAKIIVERLGQPKPLSLEEMAQLAEMFDVDEINIVARNGENLASTEARLVGISFLAKPMTRKVFP